MNILRKPFWILASLPLFACEKGATCEELGDYVFSASPEVLEVSANNNYALAMKFRVTFRSGPIGMAGNMVEKIQKTY